MAKNYENLNLPELFLLASQRGLNNFITKNEDEMRTLLRDDDENNCAEEVVSIGKKVKSKSFRAAEQRLSTEDLNEDLDDLIDIDGLEDEEFESTTTEQVRKRLGIDSSTAKTNRDDGDQEVDVLLEDDTEEFLDSMEDYENEESENYKTLNLKKEKNMAKKDPAKNAAAKKAEPKKEAAKKAAPKKAVANDKAPYQEGTAGFCAYLALKKGGQVATVVKNTDILIKKVGAKPPADTAAKVKIIMSEINKGKKDPKWGTFTLNDKTKSIKHVPA